VGDSNGRLSFVHVLTASACNTVKGAGQDLKSASQTTEDAINGR